MGTKGDGRRRKTRFHPGAKRGHFTGKTRGKPVSRGDKEERGKRKAARRARRQQTRLRNQQAFSQGVSVARRIRQQQRPPLPPVE